MLVEALLAMETDHQLVRDQQPRRRQGSSPRAVRPVTARQNAVGKGQRGNVPVQAAPANGLGVLALLALACVAVSLIVLPLVLPPLPPPPPMLLLVPVCLLLLLAALATFVPSDMRSVASSYL